MQGFVEKIGEKHGTSKTGAPYTIYSVNVNGGWLGAGFDRPACKEGDHITYEEVQKGQYKNIGSVVVNAGAAGGASTVTPISGAGNAAVRVDTRDISIRYQSCRKDALALTKLLLESDALKLPAKQADKVDAAMAFIEDVTNQYYIALQGVMDAGGLTVEDLVPTPTGGIDDDIPF